MLSRSQAQIEKKQKRSIYSHIFPFGMRLAINCPHFTKYEHTMENQGMKHARLTLL